MAELDQLRTRVRAFLAQEIATGGFTPHCDPWLIGFNREFSLRLGAAGLIGLMLPTQYGGGGGTMADRLIVSEELLAAGAPVTAHWFAERQFAPSVLRHGTSEQKDEWLPRVIRGEICIAVGLSEPDAGSDLAAVRTKAERTDGGWFISGTKIWTSGAHLADAIVVLARTSGEKHDGLSQFIVRLPNSDVSIRGINMISGDRHFNEVHFESTFVPDADVLGEIGQGWKQAMEELAYERVGPERYLSTLPLLQELISGLGENPESSAALGAVLADIRTFRTINQRVIEHLDSGNTAAIDIPLLKTIGTNFEQSTVLTALAIANDPSRTSAISAKAQELLREAQYQAPSFSIRGGTNEVLRGIVSKGLLR